MTLRAVLLLIVRHFLSYFASAITPNDKIIVVKMQGFIIFAIVVTVIYIIYYTMMITNDLYKKPKEEKSNTESFDVADLQENGEDAQEESTTQNEQDEAVCVSESEGGFSVGDNHYETRYEDTQEDSSSTSEESKAAVRSVIDNAQSKMETIQPQYSDVVSDDEMKRLIISGAMTKRGHQLKVESSKGDI